jgi:hypothetical protein
MHRTHPYGVILRDLIVACKERRIHASIHRSSDYRTSLSQVVVTIRVLGMEITIRDTGVHCFRRPQGPRLLARRWWGLAQHHCEHLPVLAGNARPHAYRQAAAGEARISQPQNSLAPIDGTSAGIEARPLPATKPVHSIVHMACISIERPG